MSGNLWPPDDPDLIHPRTTSSGSVDLVSDDDHSVAADSWSIRSEYGSTLDDEQRHVDASEVFSTCTMPTASDYSSDKEAPDASDVEASVLGLQKYWDDTYAEDLTNFREHGHVREIWFGAEVMDIVITWTKSLCINFVGNVIAGNSDQSDSSHEICKDLSRWNVLDVGTGNGLLLQELKKQGFTDLTGTDYSEPGINLARSLAAHAGCANINFLADDILDSKLQTQYNLVMDKGTLDVIGLHPEGSVRRLMYWESISRLVVSGGILVVTSCYNTKDELVQEVENFNQKKACTQDLEQEVNIPPIFQYLDHIQTHPTTIMMGGLEGSQVATVAFLRN